MAVIGVCAMCFCNTLDGVCYNPGCYAGGYAGGYPSNAKPTMPQPGYNQLKPIMHLVTLDEYKKDKWDELLGKLNLLTEPEQKMVYYYLNKQGMSVTNLDFDIDRTLASEYNRKYPKKV